MIELTENPPLGLYIHLPWCEKKCPYCDFNSHVQSDIPEKSYIHALLEDLEQELPLIWGRPIESIFIGGGTPSLFSGESIDQLMSHLRAYLNFSPLIEVTMESNPASAEYAKYQQYREAGVNRLSIGAQSFNNRQLQLLGRVHGRDDIFAAVEAAQKTGFDSINCDVMFALPEQSLQDALNDVTEAVNLGVDHLSYYQLTIEPNTFFHSHLPAALPSEDLAWDMQQQGQKLLNDTGYHQYEISAYAKQAKQCRHNVNYWQFGDYIGIGAGAHGKLSIPAESTIIRRQKVRDPKTYMQAQGTGKYSQQHAISEDDLVFEFMLNSLRLTQGFPLALFNKTTGLKTHAVMPAITKAMDLGLLTLSNFYLKPTELGLQFHNDLQSLFLDVKSSQNLL